MPLQWTAAPGASLVIVTSALSAASSRRSRGPVSPLMGRSRSCPNVAGTEWPAKQELFHAVGELSRSIQAILPRGPKAALAGATLVQGRMISNYPIARHEAERAVRRRGLAGQADRRPKRRKRTMPSLRVSITAALAASAVSLLAAAASAADGPKIAVDLTTLTSPFWTAYNKFIVTEANAQGVDLLQPFNSEFDTAKQITGVKDSITLGAKGIIFSPFDSSAAGTVLKTAEGAKVPVVAVDVAPTSGPVAIVVRANNVAYGEKACKYIGEHVAEGPVVQIMGDQASINGRDRGNGFRDCITKNYPKLKLLEIPTKAWSGEDAAAGLDTILNSTPDLKAIYMHAGGVFLAPTLQTLKRRGLLHPAGEAGHIIIVSNDGIPQEFDAIRKGEADATVSQPADLYAKYGIMYLKEAIEGKTFKAGATDHDSTIVQVAPGVLEDQLSAPLVTKANVDDKAFWGNLPK
jgi:ribose transport system substrate-binding protein